jgi:hypothetical protein
VRAGAQSRSARHGALDVGARRSVGKLPAHDARRRMKIHSSAEAHRMPPSATAPLLFALEKNAAALMAAFRLPEIWSQKRHRPGEGGTQRPMNPRTLMGPFPSTAPPQPRASSHSHAPRRHATREQEALSASTPPRRIDHSAAVGLTHGPCCRRTLLAGRRQAYQ